MHFGALVSVTDTTRMMRPKKQQYHFSYSLEAIEEMIQITVNANLSGKPESNILVS